MKRLEQIPMIGMYIGQAIDDVIAVWGDDLLVIGGNVNHQEHNEVKPLTTVMYNQGRGYNLYTLYINGDVYRVTSEDKDSGYTWNGDDHYYKSASTFYTVHEKVGDIEINRKLDYSQDESTEILACQFIECLRNIKK